MSVVISSNRSCLDKPYKSMICPLLDYCDVIYDSCIMYESQDLTNYKGKPVYYALVLLESLVMKKY